MQVMGVDEARMTEAFIALAHAIASEIARRANRDGIVPRTASVELQQAIDLLIMSFFIGRNRRGERAPFEILPDGSVFPLSTYMRLLWTGITEATRIPVEQNAAMLTKRLPLDVLSALQVARRNPFQAAQTGGQTPIFRPNPLAKYEPAHLWVDPHGYILSDRVWNTAGNTRSRLDAFLEDRIRHGQGALQMSRELETFLVPGRALRTSKPYGTDASFDAMRLARTEIARAHAAAAQTSAALNPFVQGLRWNTSGSHPKPDICDWNAAGSPYPIDRFPTMPAHPHCMCYTTYEMVGNPQHTLDAMREDIRRARRALVDLIGPVRVDEFVRLLLSSPLEVDRALPEMPGVIFA